MTTSGNHFALARIGQIAVRVHDLDRAIAFYRDRLGMRFLLKVPGMAIFDCGGIRLALSIPESARFDHPASIIYYRVDDIGGAHEPLAARGVPFEGKPHSVAKLPDHELWMAFFRDVDDNVLALMSEVRSRPER